VEALIEELMANDNVPEKIVDPAAAIQHFGALKEMGLDYGWGPTAFFEWTIEHIYMMSGYGWGASIIITTLLIRIGLLRFQFKASDNMAKMAAVTPLVRDLHKEMTEAIKSGDEAKSRVAKSKQAAIYKEVGTNPLSSMMPAVWQGVLGYGAFRCLRGMSSLPVPGLDQGGFAWFRDLTIADPYYILPALSGGIMYLLMKVCLIVSISMVAVNTFLRLEAKPVPATRRCRPVPWQQCKPVSLPL
jgi:YidC/Oxa1 family membrane protein insertase